MRRRVDGTFEKRECDRSIKDLVMYIVFLGAGLHLHACRMDKLFDIMKHKERYGNLSEQDFEMLIRQCHGRRHRLWKIEVKGDLVIVK